MLGSVSPLIKWSNLQRYYSPQLEHNTHRSYNMIEPNHKLRTAVPKIGGKKELTEKSSIAMENSNQCSRLAPNAKIHYDSTILSCLLERLETES
ncbi:Tn3 family transposase [Salmonella enterica]|uniref:Tn3 family transposase n=1 Tax=Salmonella enterica TaxID=28901 RepID=UPI0027BA3E93|nr:Tn3 family transposase [Salmonella enterica]